MDLTPGGTILVRLHNGDHQHVELESRDPRYACAIRKTALYNMSTLIIEKWDSDHLPEQ